MHLKDNMLTVIRRLLPFFGGTSNFRFEIHPAFLKCKNATATFMNDVTSAVTVVCCSLKKVDESFTQVGQGSGASECQW